MIGSTETGGSQAFLPAQCRLCSNSFSSRMVESSKSWLRGNFPTLVHLPEVCSLAASGDIVDLVAVAGLAMMLAFMYIRQGVYHLDECLGYSSVAYHRWCITCFDKCGHEGDTDTRRQGQHGTF